MKFIRNYLKKIIIECLHTYDRPPMVIEILQPKDCKEVNVNLSGCTLMSYADNPGISIVSKSCSDEAIER